MEHDVMRWRSMRQAMMNNFEMDLHKSRPVAGCGMTCQAIDVGIRAVASKVGEEEGQVH